ncbi:MAG: hypothetical protein CEN88_91 [Candidatus Berkelbacteria bacterium Licking1014_2]|uniref:Uncharacterized protein n=1 Tax=Candidatus Berkelbacteria bacterium Licking1014_2 TaxID=2017146 RepID=A0A554LWM8_9BACT|nr:MAG: hypothetical protein CEN88_91 [Candidatus Berkelbacteria bacterium Licking1014_2]
MTAMAELMETMAHDKINRWAKETKLTPSILGEYTAGLVDKRSGYVICDDSIIEKDRVEEIDLTTALISFPCFGAMAQNTFPSITASIPLKKTARRKTIILERCLNSLNKDNLIPEPF